MAGIVKQLFLINRQLEILKRDITLYSDKVKASLKIVGAARQIDLREMDESQVQFARKRAGRIIKRAILSKQTKEQILTNPYFAFLSMIDKDDAQLQLSAIMFGRHVAELRIDARERIDNPLINISEYYHRSNNLKNEAITAFFKEFGIPKRFDEKNYTYVAITRLKNSPVEEDIIHYFNNGEKKDLVLLEKAPYTIAVLAIPTDDLKYVELVKDRIKHFGLVASSWEIAENVRVIKYDEHLLKDKPKIKLAPNLPRTKEGLINSEIFYKLSRIASSDGRYATKKLAHCLKKILEGRLELSEGAIKRIALMLDLTNRFYENHYPRYAFCVYVIVHEISLALLSNKDKAFLDAEYDLFLKESRSTLNKTLNLDEAKLSNSIFVALSSTSGVNAYAIAMRIAAIMKTPDGVPPTVHMVKPCYYELPYISSLKEASPADDADIFMISAGPIVNPDGLAPGIDINLFVKNHIIDTKREKPTTIIIDATTALYKNIKLDQNVRELVEVGKLSIIINESHQKFGLIHTDEAQYGRVFGWCSKENFAAFDIGRFAENAREDYDNHVDIRIGAFISTRCEEILEDIKLRHFTNGGILRSILSETKLVTMDIVSHEDMLPNLDELYFLNDIELGPQTYTSNLEKAAYGVIDYRSSFGHYMTTTNGVETQRRMSPSASDTIDCLVEASHIRLAADKSPKAMLGNLISRAINQAKLSLEEQIITIAMLHNIIFNIHLPPNAIGNVSLIELTGDLLADKKIMQEEKIRLMFSKKHPKDIILIRKPNKSIEIGYCTLQNQYMQKAIQDRELLAMPRWRNFQGKISIKEIRACLRKFEANVLPKDTNLPVVFAAISNALACCPLLNNRQHVMNIKSWLSHVREKIIIEYNPKKKVEFFAAIRNLYNMQILLNEDEINILAKHPELCKYIKDTNDELSLRAAINFYKDNGQYGNFSYLINNKEFFALLLASYKSGGNTVLASKDNYSSNIGSDERAKDFSKAILKVYKSNKEILLGLSKSSAEYKRAKVRSKDYLQICVMALHIYYSKPNPEESDKNKLIKSVKFAERHYLKVLAKESVAAKSARYILMAVTNFIAALLVVPLYLNYRSTGKILFFSSTRSQSKLQEAHRELYKDYDKLVVIPAVNL